ncbi:DUF1828 domain-containing protein [Bifidobacterium pseudolongum]|uniref:DUF1828 domain-containing protein n=1 Tax=Bifidobacterium pseudolongum TaxID=1694 RepID=UPI001020CE41|nr:DUF1828 domain-containing protein [Bifidobacterium pseudolongum]RYQ56959.1 hypothetical protein PG1616B_1040 [Bifidobacterium pseudolongum subsp. globosum]
MSTTESLVKPDELIEEYSAWLRRESSAKDLGEWKEISLPMLDNSNDYVMFYAKVSGSGIMFTDDGYTLESFRQSGLKITPARQDRMERIARKFGAKIRDNEVTLESDGSRADAMNRFAQALLAIGSMVEAAQRRVSEYFVDDVAAMLDEHGVFYTPNIGIRGVSGYEHNWLFPF